jgi:hypothetical protein
MNASYTITKLETGLWALKIGHEIVGSIATLDGDGAINQNHTRAYQATLNGLSTQGTLAQCKKWANFWLAQLAR